MSGTAISRNRFEDTMCSRYAENSLSTTAKPDSLSTMMLGGALIIPWEVISIDKQDASIEDAYQTSIELGPASFRHFIDTIDKPPSPNANLERILRSDFE